ncbi:uncharacterized protein CIMG_13257 [Coccidioides immitis RS]|uniref:Uncharacterized protein n=1 Tax=Coccidioides immitis (strain RS) TaxID=246410 RepID=A0A0D8JX14_COCIM|nr:uncharacterized protein CIMG_13257 [Coccidioides immitis RS]KJF60818.1 hypothetical protein CIMG_13257 [Coccidioides immitis RS]
MCRRLISGNLFFSRLACIPCLCRPLHSRFSLLLFAACYTGHSIILAQIPTTSPLKMGSIHLASLFQASNLSPSHLRAARKPKSLYASVLNRISEVMNLPYFV